MPLFEPYPPGATLDPCLRLSLTPRVQPMIDAGFWNASRAGNIDLSFPARSESRRKH
jgi:hypothetical protein